MIRPGTADDAEGVARVQVETWQSAYAHALPSEQLEALSLEEAFERHRRWPPTFVADDGGQIVGFVSVGSSRDPGTDGELFAIYVHPEQWGTGVGRELIEAGEEELRRLGHREAILWVLDDNRGRGVSTRSQAGQWTAPPARSASSASTSQKSVTRSGSRPR